jgi:cytochrome c553
MKASKIASAAACIAAALGITTAAAQQPAPPAPTFAPSDLSPAGVAALAATCAACHGTDGKAVVDKDDMGLAGMPRERIAMGLAQFKAGERSATVMHQLAKGFTEAEIAALADYFSKLPR